MALISLGDWIDRYGDAALEQASAKEGRTALPVSFFVGTPRIPVRTLRRTVGARRRNASRRRRSR
jgi:hypothetical protein